MTLQQEEIFDPHIGVSESSIRDCSDKMQLIDWKLDIDRQIRELRIAKGTMISKGTMKLEPIRFHRLVVKMHRMSHLSQCIQRRQTELKKESI